MSQATHRQPLDKALRRALEATVIKARDIAELAATQALTRLSIGEAKPADYLNEEQRELRNRLRAHGRQLGDIKQDNKQQSISRLVTEAAYQHWHRMLFARFLEQNNLLMYDEHTPLSLAECNELVQDPDTLRDEQERRCQSGWELAGVLASKMLPQIFRIDSPVFALEFAPEHQRELEKLVNGLATDTFRAQDSLGWVYQFWQSKRKEEVNRSEVKIGADELSPVTQLFTEPYMVSFLLDNSLGAWWAGQRFTDHDWQTAQSEQELRDKAAIPGVPLSYLRFVKDENSQQWQPASGTFDAWPKHLSELKALDPCCGSGHFLVAAFLMLVPMRMELDALSAHEAVDAVLRENIHGLELDQRCVELAAFALALAAWQYPNAGGYRVLPELNVACSGLSISAKKEEWLALAGDNTNLRIVLEELYTQFKDAPVLGSLINPEASLGKGSLFELKWEAIAPLLSKALSGEKNDDRIEMGVVAKGISKAASLLISKYSWIITNVPYLGMKRMTPYFYGFCENNFSKSKADLATVFLERWIDGADGAANISMVMPQNWLFLGSYKQFREELLRKYTINFSTLLGSGAFETISGEVVKATLFSLTTKAPTRNSKVFGVDVSNISRAEDKATRLSLSELAISNQAQIITNPDSRMVIGESSNDPLLGSFGISKRGVVNGDNERWILRNWEVLHTKDFCHWQSVQTAVNNPVHYGGRELRIDWSSNGDGMLRPGLDNPTYGQHGAALSRMGKLPVTLYTGQLYDQNAAVIVPNDSSFLSAIFCYAEDSAFHKEVRKIDKKVGVTPATFLKIPINLDHWTAVAEEKYPNGLPDPYTDDPTQWIFHGHPCGSVIWDEDSKWTAHGELRVDDSVLQVAVARLLGYRWPAELDAEMELAVEQREWVARCQELAGFVDDDGIVCLPPVRGEKAADQRLEALLQAAYGDAWTTPLKNRLLEAVGSKSLSLWLRDKFFEQHCKMFQHRPFIWHIWDGLKDGFSALVNYHKLDKAGLERLIYTYLGDWIRTQQAGLANGEDGAQERLAAAEALKKELEAILEGEKPYDIFVRWKPLAEQPIGWTPDLNDGVRLNIRPFLYARDVSKKDAGILRWKPNIHWKKDRGKDVESAPWYELGLEYGEGVGARINDHHLSLAEKHKARESKA